MRPPRRFCQSSLKATHSGGCLCRELRGRICVGGSHLCPPSRKQAGRQLHPRGTLQGQKGEKNVIVVKIKKKMMKIKMMKRKKMLKMLKAKMMEIRALR